MTSSRDTKDGSKTELKRNSDQDTPTIVGGRPPGDRYGSNSFPLGIEVLLKKASVDPAFRKALLEKRSEAAKDIGLELSPSEAATLNTVPRSHIKKIIERTTIPDEHRRIFLGHVAAAMLALLGIPASVAAERKSFDVAWEFRLGGMTHDMPRNPLLEGDRTPSFKKYRKHYAPQQAKSGRLRIRIIHNSYDSVTLSVQYDCPFDKGELKIFFGRDDKSSPPLITVEPQQCPVSRGSGEEIFFVKGKEGETQRLLVGIGNTDGNCARDLWQWLDWLKLRGPDCLYAIPGCAVFTIVRFKRKWP